jgi:N-acylglucosamine 2-epimerase
LNRRTFHQSLLGASAMAAAPVVQKDVSSLNLPAERSEYRKGLFEDFLPFMEKYVVDAQYGGFMCTVRPNGERVSTAKRTWFEGRGSWVYAFLYNNLAREQKYLDVAERSLSLLRRSAPKDPDEFWPISLNRDGSPASPPDTEVYSDMFVAEGMAEYSKAVGDRKYWDEAREIVLKCARRYDRTDYHPSIGATYLGAGATPFPGARVEGVWMVFIRTIKQMLAMRPDNELKALCDRSIDALLNHHFNPRFQLINELMNHDLSRPTNEYEQLVYAGHAIETLWMVMDEARRRGDKALLDRTAILFQRHCEVARDRVYGGLFRNLTNVDKNAWTMDKTLFPHQEGLIGSMLLIEEKSDPWALSFYHELAEYTRAKFPMRSLHSPLWQVIGDRHVTPTPEMTRAENYHQPRFLMLNLLAVERMMKRGA